MSIWRRLFGSITESASDQSGEVFRYCDEILRFSFELPAGWMLEERIPPFGCIVTSRHGPLTVRAGEVEDHLNQRETRKDALLDYLRSLGFRDIFAVEEDRAFAGEENVIFHTYERPDGKRGFGISVVHNTVQYNVQADGFPDPFLKETIDALERSFRFAPDSRVDFLKRLAKRREV
jgi:hypothetical protein